MEQSPTRELARFVTNLKYDDLPLDVVDHVKLAILDAIGVGIFSGTKIWGKIMADFVRECGGVEEAEVWGYEFKTSSVNAALANGTFAHGFELEDLHLPTTVHPGGVTVPPALATATHKRGVSGKQCITAVAAGFEAVIRVGLCVNQGAVKYGQMTRGWHSASTCGPFGAAASAGKILELDEERMLHALAIAGNQSTDFVSGPTAAMDKRMGIGRAAQSGVIAALLAEKGFTGITNLREVIRNGGRVLQHDLHFL